MLKKFRCLMNGHAPSVGAFAIAASAGECLVVAIMLLVFFFNVMEGISLFRKKRGEQPTGQLFHKARENGFSSVSEMLQVKSPQSFVGKVTRILLYLLVM